MVSAPSLRGPSHTNPGPVQSGLTGHSKPKNIQASGFAGSMFIISNVWAGFCWKES